MKKLFGLILFITFIEPIYSQANTSKYVVTEDTRIKNNGKTVGIVFKGDTLSALVGNSDVIYVDHNGSKGYVSKLYLEEIITPINPYIDKVEDKDLAMLIYNTSKANNSATSLYISTGIGVITGGIGGAIYNKNNNAGTVLFIVAGISSVSAIVSGICFLEFQKRVNRNNVKLQLKANGVNINF
ncbi:MAG: hypothetical protein PUB21_07945 [Bacteroidales bacterium]|nr:hypothetical protein [Bacteroidales bacterium]